MSETPLCRMWRERHEREVAHEEFRWRTMEAFHRAMFPEPYDWGALWRRIRIRLGSLFGARPKGEADG